MAPRIKEENDTFIQIKRTKRVNLKVGEKAILLARQPIKVVCPVENFDKKLIFWTRNRRLVPVVNPNRPSSRKVRVIVSRTGALRIRRTDPNLDKGEFTCIAGMQSASVYLDFATKRNAVKASRDIIKNMVTEKGHEPSIDQPQADNVPGSRVLANSKYSINQIINNDDKKYVFTTSDWSTCSKTCGIGVQTRDISCVEASVSFIKVLSKEKCLGEGHIRPVNVKQCFIQSHCPGWDVGAWQEVSDTGNGSYNCFICTVAFRSKYNSYK